MADRSANYDLLAMNYKPFSVTIPTPGTAETAS